MFNPVGTVLRNQIEMLDSSGAFYTYHLCQFMYEEHPF